MAKNKKNERGELSEITKRFNGSVIVKANGVRVEIRVDGTVKVAPAAANDTAIKAAKYALELGRKMADGSVYAGKAVDGKLIFAMPNDLDVTMTFNDAAKAVKTINKNKSLGHDDWQIPSLENVRALQKNQNEGALKGTFKTAASSGSDYPDWYWSSTEYRDDSSYVLDVRFSDGDEGGGRKDGYRLSCRPVRLVAASSARFVRG